MTKERPIRFRHYDMIRALGDGPFGAVYLAYDIKWERHVALKLLHSHLVPNTIAMKRFINEGRTMQELRHLDIVKISHVEEDSLEPYIEMEFVNAVSLEHYLQSGMLPMQRLLRFLRQIADILDTVHEQGIIHRNLKPSNVLIDQEGNIKLADFGLNLLIEGTEDSAITDMFLGDPRYLAPEQTKINRHHEISAVTDIYALGVIAFQMLTGSVPFDGRSNAILSAHRTLPPPNPRHLGIKLSTPITAVLMQALAKEPVERYVTSGAFVTALEQAAHTEEATLLHPPSLITQPLTLLKNKAAYGVTKALPATVSIQYRKPALIVGALLLLILITGAALRETWTNESPPAATEQLSVKPSPTSQASQNTPAPLVSDKPSVTPTAQQKTSPTTVAEKATASKTPIASKTAGATETAIATNTQSPTQPRIPTPPQTATVTAAPAAPATVTAAPATATMISINSIVIPASPTAIQSSPTAIQSTPTAIQSSPTAIPATPTAIPATQTAIPATQTATPTAIPATPTAIPATPTAIPASPTAIPILPPLPPLESPTIQTPIINAPIPASPTPFATIQTVVPTEAAPSASPIFVPITETPITPTAPIIPPTSDNPPIFTLQPTATPTYRYRINAILPNVNQACGHYTIFGYVHNSQGVPLADIRVRIYNEYGDENPIILTKREPLGLYEQPISSEQAHWYVELVDTANTPLSPTAELINTGNVAEGGEACWHQVDFWGQG